MLKPMNDYILVRLLDDDKVTASGIVLPDSADPMYSKGVILDFGPGMLGEDGSRVRPGVEMVETDIPLAPKLEDLLSLGEKILFARYAAVKIEEEGETFYFVKETDILAKIQ